MVRSEVFFCLDWIYTLLCKSVIHSTFKAGLVDQFLVTVFSNPNNINPCTVATVVTGEFNGKAKKTLSIWECQFENVAPIGRSLMLIIVTVTHGIQ